MASNLTHDDFVEIQRVCDDRYVMQADCNERQEKNNKRFAEDDKRIEKLMERFGVWDKLLWVIATAVVSALVVALIDLILK